MKAILFDDDPLVLKALKTILSHSGFDVAASEVDARNSVDLYLRHRPDIVLMDIMMKEQNGIDAALDIINADKDAKILLLTTFDDYKYISRALAIGCKGYILKQSIDRIVPSIDAIYAGSMVFDEEIIYKLQSQDKEYTCALLSERENQIMASIAGGLSNREISETLFLSEGTVRNYISNILDKLNLRDRTQIAIFYYKNK